LKLQIRKKRRERHIDMWRSSWIDRFVVQIDSERRGLNGETRKAALNPFEVKALASQYTMNNVHLGKLEIVFKFR
jgi:hypothetical protein